MSEIISNSLQILNVSDGTFDIEWQGELAAPPDNPEKGWIYYDTTQGGTFLYDGTNWYPISKDAQEGIVDQRFSDNLNFKIFTEDENGENWGTTPGNYIGFRIVNKPPETLEELAASFDEYTWSVYTVNVAFNSSYDLIIDKNIIYKFFQTNNNNYNYSPSSINLSLVTTSNEITMIVDDFTNVTCHLSFLFNGQTSLSYPQEGEMEFNNIIDLSLILSELNALSYDLEQINIDVFKDKTLIVSKTLSCVYGVSAQLAKLSINANNINAFVEEAALTFNGSGLKLKNGSFVIEDSAGQKLIYSEGNNLIIKGTLNSNSGNIGGWLIGESQLYSNTNSVGMYSGNKILLNNSPIRFYSGTKGILLNNITDTQVIPFVVNDDGYIQAKNANITGTIYASSGAITDTFYVGSAEDGIILNYNKTTGVSYIGSNSYSSGNQGYGWRIESDGKAEFTNLSARGKIASSVFEYQKTSSIGGSLYITPTIYLNVKSSIITKNENSWIATWSAREDSPIGVGGRVWSIGDEIRLEGILIASDYQGSNEKISLNNIAGKVIEVIVDDTKTNVIKITVSFESSLIDFNKENYFIEGALLMFYGAYNNENQMLQKSGIYITAMDQDAPYIDIYDIDSMAVYMPTVRLGKLTGITNALFSDNSLTGYGLYSDRAYLTGQLVLPGAGVTNESIEYVRDNISYGDIRFWAGENHTNAKNAPFVVTSDGSIFASKGIFSGRVEATDGFFSGLIKAAGLLVDRLKTNEIIPSSAAANHFFVAYSTSINEEINTIDTIQSYDDYIVDISAHGISIWEGALQAYSDSASKSRNNVFTHPIYGYDQNNLKPLPYFYLVDTATNVNEDSMTLNSRAVTYKQHIFQANLEDGDYTWKGILLDNGIWFGSGVISGMETNDKKQVETKALSSYQSHGIQKTNLNTMDFISSGGYNFKNGNVNIVNDLYIIEGTKKGSIDIGGISIEQAFSGNTTIGINFV